MRLSSFWCLLVVLGTAAVCRAQVGSQPTTTPPAAPSAPDAGTAGAPAAEPPGTGAAPAFGEPSGTVPDSSATVPAEPPSGVVTSEPVVAPAPLTAAEGASLAESTNIPSPGELGDRLVGDLQPESQVKPTWTAPVPVLTLHGYLRVRGELMDTFWLGRAPNVELYPAAQNALAAGPDPFTRFRPFERSKAGVPCADEGGAQDSGLAGTVCDVDTLQFANVRFRMSPQLNISEDVRVKATFDVLDNFALGKGPESYYGTGETARTVFAGTDLPTGQTIVARRAWAEVRNRDLGELRFGLMPEHWGLGMLYNSGDKLDDDYSTDVGRVMGITKIAGFYLSAAYDFLAEGELGTGGEFRSEYDRSQLDDVDQFTFSVVRRVPDEDEAAVLERGELLLNGGVRFQLRHQDSVYERSATDPDMDTLRTVDATLYTPDIWGQLRYRGLRLELEAAGVFGSLRDTAGNERDVVQFGATLEGEVRLLDDKLGVYLYGGFASGDSDVEGLSSDANYIDQLGFSNSTVSTFRFHPSYRVDNILWRNIMRQVTGAYYLKPGISYDFVRDDFGQLFGARLDVIWSRASSFLQTPGNSENLGVELNAQIYWRSDDGPEKDDGYHASLQYGVLFPMDGLGYFDRSADLDTAQSLRLVLGVVY